MSNQQYVENARQIINLADGMTDAQWSRIAHLIRECINAKIAMVKGGQISMFTNQAILSMAKEVEETTDSQKAVQLLDTGKWIIIGAAYRGNEILWVLTRVD